MVKVLFMVMLHNLLLFVFAITCFGDLILYDGGINDDNFERRKLATENPGSISIDCGVEDDYFDGILFKSDKDFISSGENHEISPFYSSLIQYWYPYKTLRSFPNGGKNCYTLKLEQAKNNSYRITASFVYGNYDGNNQAPKFDLYIGVNYWVTVDLRDRTQVYYEIIHVFPADTEYFCLVNTGSGTPLISALEIIPSGSSTYRIGSSALHAEGIYDLGGQQDVVRFDDDIYVRDWQPLQLPSSVPINTSLDIYTQGSGNLYKLPAEVLRTAVQPSNGSKSLNYSSSFNSGYEYNVYFHFAELKDFAEDQLRELSITLNDKKYGPVTLEYLKPLSISFPKVQIVEGNITFTIDATMESGLPPILNAFEIYQLRQFEFSRTDRPDVDAIMFIKHTYDINRDDWQGDPCLPTEFLWSGLKCRFNSTPRIISLNLSSSKLTGEISPSLVDLQAIESIDLSYNELTGSVPEVLAQLPNLKVLNLSGNKLEGSIPRSLKDKSDNGSLLLSFTENKKSCQRDPCEENNRKFIVPLVTSILSALVLVIILSVLIRIKRRKQAEVGNTTAASNKEGLLKSKNRPFTYSEIARITANFINEIGEGGFGKVFLGHLNDGTPVAVKMLSSSSKQGYKEFQAEAQLLMIVHHKNLVSLIGYCKEDDNLALVYEFMSNGNLRQHLSVTNNTVLNWKQRLQIAIDAAQGLDYLHNGCKPPIVHRDLKTSNILLTESMQAKIADFGLSRVFSTETASHVSTSPAGTLGYLPPELQVVNKKSDIYSFGVILFELITGQPVIIRSNEYNIHLLEWVSPIIQNGDIRKVVDPKLKNEFNVNTLWKAVEIAMSCVVPTSIQRPDMSLVLAELKECLALEIALGRNDQRVQSEMTHLSNSINMNSLESDMLCLAR